MSDNQAPAAPGIRRLGSQEELELLLREAAGEAVWIFKHSSTCGISFTALREFQEFAAGRPRELFALVEVQRARELSNAIARRTGVRHESPQVLLLADGGVAWHGSHWEITRAALTRAAGAGERRA